MSDRIKFTLDGKEVEADKGLTIWEIANGRGLVIPHLCHKPQPGYRPDGNCRLEEEGEEEEEAISSFTGGTENFSL